MKTYSIASAKKRQVYNKAKRLFLGYIIWLDLKKKAHLTELNSLN